MTNGYTEAWRRIGAQIRKPKAILSISAHWYVPGTGVTISTPGKTTVQNVVACPRKICYNRLGQFWKADVGHFPRAPKT
jgi:aromatic ring-opening dioxygenase catalytic subunit (LigB family)